MKIVSSHSLIWQACHARDCLYPFSDPSRLFPLIIDIYFLLFSYMSFFSLLPQSPAALGISCCSRISRTPTPSRTFLLPIPFPILLRSLIVLRFLICLIVLFISVSPDVSVSVSISVSISVSAPSPYPSPSPSPFPLFPHYCIPHS